MDEREIKRLERRLERERLARQEAERLLEDKSRALFKANQALSKSLEEMENKVRQRTADLTKAKDAAEQANRFKTAFLANMSHEIRTPMNAVIGLSHLMAETDLSSKQQDYLEKIHSSARTLLGVINDVLDFSKIEAGKVSLEQLPFSLSRMIHDVMAVVQPAVEDKGLTLTFSRAPDLPDGFLGDPLRLNQVLLNLLGNAVKFTPQGRVSLTVSGQRQGSGYHLEMAVQDSGIGMSDQQVKDLFQPFRQGDGSSTRRFGGTGLGLAICHQLVGLMGGSIAVESTPGQGSTFRLTLPLDCAEAPALSQNLPLSDVNQELSLRNLTQNGALLCQLLEVADSSAAEGSPTDWASVGACCRSIKGIAGTLKAQANVAQSLVPQSLAAQSLAAQSLAALAEQLEGLAAHPSPDRQQAKALAQTLSDAIAALDEGLSSQPSRAAVALPSQMLPQDVLAAELAGLQDLLETYDPAAGESADLLRRHLAGTPLESAAAKVAKYATAFDFDDALEALKALHSQAK